MSLPSWEVFFSLVFGSVSFSGWGVCLVFFLFHPRTNYEGRVSVCDVVLLLGGGNEIVEMEGVDFTRVAV